MIGERIKELRKELNLSQKEFSQKIGVPQTSLSQYENRDSIPSELIDKISNAFELNLNWFLSGKGEMFSTSQQANHKYGNLVYIDILDASVSAGAGIESWDIEILNKSPVTRGFIAPYPVNKVKAIWVSGDSMTPTIYNGDLVYFALETVAGNGIYIIEIFGEHKVKRLDFKLNGDIIIISDNERYEKEIIKRGDDTFRICGKVIGWTHKHNY